MEKTGDHPHTLVEAADPAAETGPVPVPHRKKAEHVTDDSAAFIDLCEQALHPEGLHHVAEYHRGVFNYSVDILDHPHLAHLANPHGPSEGDRALYIRVGRQLNFLLGRMDRSLRPVESGRLIRTVLRLGQATLFHYYVRPGRYLTGVSLGREAAEAGDRAMTRLATGFRTGLHQLRIDYGGFIGAPEASPSSERPAATEFPFAASAAQEHHREVFGDIGPDADRIGALCAASLTSKNLHYVAYVDPTSGFLSTDLLSADGLAGYHSLINRQQRRDRYHDISRRLHFVVARLNHSLKAVLPGRLTRTVLDVDEGALFYCALGNGTFLLGVTLHQDRVAHADEVMTRLTLGVQRMVNESADRDD
ncbi:hypothetical protein [Streptomyces sp. NBC_00690]|uniref:hypothetical protein n=1 Tax=Streptomyces sp. NBC_00690 TaxID=2975808 RepID=UPI002E290BC8|nr:hypothetical protein [Streptomyces sp. NBC_00690]